MMSSSGQMFQSIESLSTLGAWVSIGLMLALGVPALLLGHKLGRGTSVVLGALCGGLIGLLIGVACSIFLGRSSGLFAFAGAVLGLAGGGAAGWYLVRTTMATILGTVVGSIAASITWTALAPAPRTPVAHASVSVPMTEPGTSQDPAGVPPRTPEVGTTAVPAQARAQQPAPPKTQPQPQPRESAGERVVGTVGGMERVRITDAHGRSRMVIRTKGTSTPDSSLAGGLAALARLGSQDTPASGGQQAGGQDLSTLMAGLQSGTVDPSMLASLQSGGLSNGLDLSSLAGGMGGMGDLSSLEAQISEATAGLAALVRRVVTASLVGLVVSTLASVGAIFLKKSLTPITMATLGGACIAHALGTGLSLVGLEFGPLLLQLSLLGVTLLLAALSARYQIRALAGLSALKPLRKGKSDGEGLRFSPLAGSMPTTGTAEASEGESGREAA